MRAEAFLSPLWYRVAQMRPHLRESARIQRHRYRGDAWYVIRDPVKGRVHRLSQAAYAIVASMDGQRSLDQLWMETADLLGEEAPTQDQVIQLLSQLHASDLLVGDIPPDAQELLDRRVKQERSQLLRQLLNPLSIKLPLVHPDGFLTRTLPLVRPLLGWMGLLLWLVVVLPACMLVVRHWSELQANAGDRLLALDNLLLIAVIYPLIKILHELGHGYAAKAYGGHVPAAGVMLLVLYPMPFVDVSAAAGFRSKWHRVVVGAAGMLVEIFLAAVAVYVWVMVEPGVVRAGAFSVMVTAGISTLVFNGNPLMRYDGYYILSDLIEIPNLADRGNRYWGHLIDRYVFGQSEAHDFPATGGERAWFLFYVPVAYVYRLVVMLGIALYLAKQYVVVGIGLALAGLFSSLIMPASKGIWHVLTAPALRRHRIRAVSLTLSSVMVVAGALAWLPVPLHTWTEGVLWLPDSAVVRAGTEGFITRLLEPPGATVRTGQQLLIADDPELRAKVRLLAGQVAELEAKLDAQRFTDRAGAVVTELELGQVRDDLTRQRQREAQLISVAASDGVLSIDRPEDLPDRFVKQGDVIGHVLPPEGARIIRATVSQDDIDLVRSRVQAVAVRLAGLPSQALPARLLRETPSAGHELPHKALGGGGGGTVAVDPRDQKGMRTLQRVFQIDLELASPSPLETFGARAIVRFEHGWEPLGVMLYRRIRQLLLARLEG
jgi:putative peptide zinc metalloprotease protein